ncbi:hypothetical protein AVEN_35764-1 [Araneus ventricosus]|uniref:Uncharacterized protein n=1 Tax=Araneus ventricosus TaxID=182803 RepID=A0A4Y2QXW5_ARAVE|nr:hypothetical protein AVEN_35764-1 [Araneus ventricosus]
MWTLAATRAVDLAKHTGQDSTHGSGPANNTGQGFQQKPIPGQDLQLTRPGSVAINRWTCRSTRARTLVATTYRWTCRPHGPVDLQKHTGRGFRSHNDDLGGHWSLWTCRSNTGQWTPSTRVRTCSYTSGLAEAHGSGDLQLPRVRAARSWPRSDSSSQPWPDSAATGLNVDLQKHTGQGLAEAHGSGTCRSTRVRDLQKHTGQGHEIRIGV